MINGVDFKTDSGLGIPDSINFRKDRVEFLRTPAAVGQMNPQVYAIDRLETRCRYCFLGSGSGVRKEKKGCKQTQDG
ncbi:MAG: hypothetical protein HKP52_07175 [Desulfofustis sp.]|nr:hypothetical protein [Desulfofustis sp.]